MLCCSASTAGLVPSECNAVGMPMVDSCAASCEKPQGARCFVQFTVHKVVVERRFKAAPLLRWLVGHRPSMFVEVTPVSMERESQQTQSGIFSTEEEVSGTSRMEVWMWNQGESPAKPGAPKAPKAKTGESTRRGECLCFDVFSSTVLVFRVWGSHVRSTMLGEPYELLGEIHFKMDDDMRTGTLPLMQNQRICGSLSMQVSVCESLASENELPPRSPPGSRTGSATRSPTGSPSWLAESTLSTGSPNRPPAWYEEDLKVYH